MYCIRFHKRKDTEHDFFLNSGEAAHSVEGDLKLGNNEFYLGTIDDVPSILVCIAVKKGRRLKAHYHIIVKKAAILFYDGESRLFISSGFYGVCIC